MVTLAILGMLYKIVPFLVWYARYSQDIGRSKVPALADLYSTRLQAAGYWLFVAGLASVSVTSLLGNERAVQWSCALLAGSIVVFAVNMGKIFSHLVRPRIEPHVFQPMFPGKPRGRQDEVGETGIGIAAIFLRAQFTASSRLVSSSCNCLSRISVSNAPNAGPGFTPNPIKSSPFTNGGSLAGSLESSSASRTR